MATKLERLMKKVVLKQFESSENSCVEIMDLISEPFTKKEIAFLKKNKCDFMKMDGGRLVCTPGDEISLFKINIKGKIHFTAGDFDQAFIFKHDKPLEDIFEFISENWGFSDDDFE